MTLPPYHADFSIALLPHRMRTGVGSSMRASIKGAKKSGMRADSAEVSLD
jgi:hypothetical protein